MTTLKLIWLNFRGHLKSNLAMAAAIAVACATLAGSLIVGDSIRLSLRKMALDRLGDVSCVVKSQGFFADDLDGRLSSQLKAGENTAVQPVKKLYSAILNRGAAFSGDTSRTAAGVLVNSCELVPVKSGSCVINELLAEKLSVQTGDEIVLRISTRTSVSAQSPLIGLKRSERLSGLRLTVESIAENESFTGAFELYPTQQSRPVVWLNMADMQRSSYATNMANAVIACGDISDEEISKALAAAVEAKDFALQIQPVAGGAAVSSLAINLPPAVEKAFASVPGASRVATGLSEEISIGNRRDNYALACGMDSPPGGPLADGCARVNSWLGERLGLSPDEPTQIQLSYFYRGPDGAIATKAATLTVTGIVETAGLGADATLAPQYPGISDSDRIDDWNAPGGLNIDLSLIDDEQELYWEKYRAAPRLFVNYATAQKLWAADQTATSVRLTGDAAIQKARQIVTAIAPQSLGMEVIPIRQLQLKAAAGSSDFAQLLASLSGLIWMAAIALAALIMTLTMQSYQRDGQIMLKLGHRPEAIIRIFAGEIILTAAIAIAAGSAAAVVFAWLMIQGFTTVWIGATQTQNLQLFVEWPTIARFVSLAAIAALVISGLVTQRQTKRIAAGQFLRTISQTKAAHNKKRYLKILRVIILIALPIALAAASIAKSDFIIARPIISGVAAAIWILTAALSRISRGKSLSQLSPGGKITRTGKNARLTVIAASQSPLRLLLVAAMTTMGIYGLSLCAIFSDTSRSPQQLESLLVVDLASPVAALPTSPQNRRLLGINPRQNDLWDRLAIAGVKIHRNEDISCNNMTRPASASVAAVEITDEKAIKALKDFENIYQHLENSLAASPRSENRPPAVADAAAAQYILQVKPGQSIVVNDATGQSVVLRLAETFNTDTFAGELLVSSQTFGQLYPQHMGFNRLLVSAADSDVERVKQAIASAFGDYGAEISTLAQLRAKRLRLRGAYLSAFRLLGIIAAVLGACGLAVSLQRNLLDNRRELTMMWAMGFSYLPLSNYACGKNAVAITAGLIAAIAAILPASFSQYANSGAFAATTAIMAVISLLAILIQYLITYRFISKLSLRNLACE